VKTSKSNRTRIIIFIALAGCGLWLYVALHKPGGDALKIVSRMKSAYSTCESYRDRVEVTTVIAVHGKTVLVKKWLATVSFAQPASLRVEFRGRSAGSGKLITLIPAGSKKTMHGHGNLETSVDEFTDWPSDSWGEFRRKAVVERIVDVKDLVYSNDDDFIDQQMIALLLPEEIGGLDFDGLTDSRLMGSKKVEGAECYVLRSDEHEETFWVDTKSFALRKVEVKSKTDAFSSTKTQILHPEFGVSTRESDFVLPPKVAIAAK